MPRYQRLYAGRAYLGRDEVEPVRREVAELRERFAIGDRRRIRILPIAPPPPAGEQLELTLPDARPADLRRRARAG